MEKRVLDDKDNKVMINDEKTSGTRKERQVEETTLIAIGKFLAQ